MSMISRTLLPKRPQQLGRIKIGGLGGTKKSSRGKEFRQPEKYDHFVVTTNVRGEDGNFVRDERIHELIGDEPTELRAILMHDRPEENFHSEMVQYEGRGAKGKVWSCDGEEATNLKTGNTGTCLRLGGNECGCKPYMRLHVQLYDAPYTMGYHFYRSTSWETTNNIQTALEEIYEHFGTCAGAPVRLVIYPSEDQHEGGTSTSHKVGLVLAQTLPEVAAEMAKRREYATLASGEMKQIAAGMQEELAELDEVEAEVIGEEFFPDDPMDQTKEIVMDGLNAQDDEDAEEDEDVAVAEDKDESPELPFDDSAEEL